VGSRTGIQLRELMGACAAIPSGGVGLLDPKARDITVVKTTRESIVLEAVMDVRNPTDYSARVPYVDVNFLVNDTVLGHVTARHIHLTPGLNKNIPVRAEWAPAGESDQLIGHELLSQFISGTKLESYFDLMLRMQDSTSLSQPKPTAEASQTSDRLEKHFLD
jgi:hypothetical protein